MHLEENGGPCPGCHKYHPINHGCRYESLQRFMTMHKNLDYSMKKVLYPDSDHHYGELEFITWTGSEGGLSSSKRLRYFGGADSEKR